MSIREKVKEKLHMNGKDDNSDPEAPRLKYYDITLTNDDVDNIENNDSFRESFIDNFVDRSPARYRTDGWLSDNVISFWEEYLERNELEKEANKSAQIVLLRPSMAVLLMSSPDPQSLRSALPNFEQITHIFLPINDANNYDVTSSGTHWSLLVVSKLDGVAFHYDSMEPANIKYAKAAATKLSELLQTPLHFHEMNDCPQQDNGSDCGVFVCVAMEELLIRLLNVERAQKITMSMENRIQDKNLNSNMRTKLMKIIQGLVEQEKKRKKEETKRKREEAASERSSVDEDRLRVDNMDSKSSRSRSRSRLRMKLGGGSSPLKI